MIDLLWSVAIVAANWLGALAGTALADRRARRAGHDTWCDRWGPCPHEPPYTTTEET